LSPRAFSLGTGDANPSSNHEGCLTMNPRSLLLPALFAAACHTYAPARPVVAEPSPAESLSLSAFVPMSGAVAAVSSWSEKLPRAAARVVAAAEKAPSSPDEVFPVVSIKGHGRYLLLPEVAENNWLAPSPKLLSRDGAFVTTTRGVKRDQLPAHLAAWEGKEIRLLDADGHDCIVTAGAPMVLARLEANWVTQDRWEGYTVYSSAPSTPAQIAVESYALATMGEPELALPLSGKGCETAKAALPAEISLAWSASSPADASLQSIVRGKLREDAGYQALLARNGWRDRSSSASVEVLRAPGAPVAMVSVVIESSESLSEPRLWFSWEMRETEYGPAFSPRSDNNTTLSSFPVRGFYTPQGWQLMTEEGLLQPSASGLFNQEWRVPGPVSDETENPIEEEGGC
jgi:hypothetical protein